MIRFEYGKKVNEEHVSFILKIKNELQNSHLVTLVRTAKENILYTPSLEYVVKRHEKSLLTIDNENHDKIFNQELKPLVSTYMRPNTIWDKDISLIKDLLEKVKLYEDIAFVFKYKTKLVVEENIAQKIYNWAFNGGSWTPTKELILSERDNFINLCKIQKQDGEFIFSSILKAI